MAHTVKVSIARSPLCWYTFFMDPFDYIGRLEQAILQTLKKNNATPLWATAAMCRIIAAYSLSLFDTAEKATTHSCVLVSTYVKEAFERTHTNGEPSKNPVKP